MSAAALGTTGPDTPGSCHGRNRRFGGFARSASRRFAVLFFLAFPLAAVAGPSHADTMMPVGPVINPPSGFIDFCRRHSGECRKDVLELAVVRLTPQRRAELKDVQDTVNRDVFYTPDSRNFAKADYWEYPYIYGDCEDYALEKRRRLIALGWPRSALLLAMVGMPDKTKHLVLVAVTSDGELVLDNATKGIVSWHRANYTWLRRQSRSNESIWVSLAAPGQSGRRVGTANDDTVAGTR